MIIYMTIMQILTKESQQTIKFQLLNENISEM